MLCLGHFCGESSVVRPTGSDGQEADDNGRALVRKDTDRGGVGGRNEGFTVTRWCGKVYAVTDDHLSIHRSFPLTGQSLGSGSRTFPPVGALKSPGSAVRRPRPGGSGQSLDTA